MDMIKTEYWINAANFVWLNWLSVELVVGWYCLPDSRPLLIYNPGTLSRVTLALLGIVFQTNLIASVVCYWLWVVGCGLWVGTVFQTAVPSLFIIPRLRPGLLSLRSVLSSRQILLRR